MSSDSAIKAINLTKRYGPILAVDHINFDVKYGEVFGFLGPNGAGKTTTIKMLTTVTRPTEGTALVNGYDIVKQPAKVRESIGVVPQEYTSDEDLTGWENLMLIASLYGIPKKEAKERATELLNLVELSHAADRKVETYSGGMRRRLEIAMGLINTPKILFLDEPTLGLDAQTRAAIWSYVYKLKEQLGTTIFVTTHYLEEADQYCDRIAIIDHGKILAMGTPRDLKESIGGDVVSIQVAGNPELAVKVLQGVDGLSDVRVVEGYVRFKVKDGSRAVPVIFDILSKAGIRVMSISIKEPSMDEVFMEYTGHSLRDEWGSREEAMAMRRIISTARR
ncbi:ATP-binding cassette domain-containing protein [Caldivirga maquilingensis]|uniref:Daunorubicin resistance ABC transporter ATPase subunit n=1 Tax=Caldivirga maquilingensis (strain ATCC 700844 / DSM 13496 / JCM 10307 / IC-167) TaxID=397948 RepID=A8MBC0_CALMQ|nr:ATP-binding cassette domain-containing protein [Caldivirga maquilingensis]ABW01210.1 daunorubicin resistance ABC transporter ATPase subunit [Caldivirga maquilingensis IC-167]